jgi:predicted alpha/beta-fold hydrolase
MSTDFRPPWWLRNPHAQTLWGKFLRGGPSPVTRRERWELPDGDFLDIHRLDGAPGRPRLVLLHGLEGSVESHYVRGFFGEARRLGLPADLIIFRSCGDEHNRLLRSYHSGETGDLGHVLSKLIAEEPNRPLILAGVSLGGNVLLKYLGERGVLVAPQVKAAAAISTPFDLAEGCRHLEQGFSRIYQWHFLRTLRRKAAEKAERFPGKIGMDAVRAARTLWEFDDAVTAPVHGFASAADYYERSSSIGFLEAIRVPTLLLSAADDPFLPATVLDRVRQIAVGNAHLALEFVSHGGHVGFVGGRSPWAAQYHAEPRAVEFLLAESSRPR